MTDHLVVGIDGSEESAVALRWAMLQAARRGYSVKLVYALLIPVVSDAYGMVMTRPDVDELSAYSKGLLQAATEAAQRIDPSVEVSTALREGPPAAVLIDESKTAAGLVVGTRGLGAIAGKVLGSVSVRVSVKACCPTYVIPPEWDPVVCSADPVVVGVDGSDHSYAALRLAIAEAKLCDVAVKAVIAYHVGRLSRPVEPDLIAQLDASERAQARHIVEHALDKVGATADESLKVRDRGGGREAGGSTGRGRSGCHLDGGRVPGQGCDHSSPAGFGQPDGDAGDRPAARGRPRQARSRRTRRR